MSNYEDFMLDEISTLENIIRCILFSRLINPTADSSLDRDEH